MSISVSATNWPGGSVSASCDGDTGPSGCWGDSGAAAPGGTINLLKCSCPPWASGCVNIPTAQFPAGCTSSLSGPTCGTNQNTINMQLVLTCTPPATPCPSGGGFCGNSDGSGASACVNGAEPTSWPGSNSYDNWCAANYGGSRGRCFSACKTVATNTPVPATATPAPFCGANCAGKPANYCNAAPGCNYCNPSSQTCTAPPATPTSPPGATATPVPVCGANCSSNPNICQNIPNCNYCNPSSHICTAPPATPTSPPNATPTPTTIPVCGADCSINPNVCQNIPNCNYCNPSNKKCEAPPVCGADCSANPNVCQNLPNCNYCSPSSKKCEAQPTATPTSTPVPTATPIPTSTPTPTPLPFDESMCSCDGLNFTPIVLGSPTNITAYGKVLGINKNYAKIPTFTFTFYKSAPNSAQATILQEQKVNTTVIEDTAQKVRYQAIWVLNLPLNLDTTQTYRIQAHPDCSRKAAAAFFNSNTSIMGASTTKQPSFWDKIVGFFAGLFGGGSKPTPQAVGPTATPTLTVEQKKSLQLKTFRPVNVTTGVDAKNCTFIKFSF